MTRMALKECFVPICGNNTCNAKEKIFLFVPRRAERRRLWEEAAGYKDSKKAPGKKLYCCEDHFDLEEDSINWMFFKLAGAVLLLKDQIVPHKNLKMNLVPRDVSQMSESERKRRDDFLNTVNKQIRKLEPLSKVKRNFLRGVNHFEASLMSQPPSPKALLSSGKCNNKTKLESTPSKKQKKPRYISRGVQTKPENKSKDPKKVQRQVQSTSNSSASELRSKSVVGQLATSNTSTCVTLKECFVPTCENTTRNAKQKLFLLVPQRADRRKLWVVASGYKDIKKAPKKHLYCCEDHFDLKQDSANWMFFKIAGAVLTLKEHIVPHTNLAINLEPRDVSQLSQSDRKRKQEFLKAVDEQRSKENNEPPSKVKRKNLLNQSVEMTQCQVTSTSSELKSKSLADLMGTSTSTERITTISWCESKSRFYLGLPAEIYTFTKVATIQASLSHRDVLLTIKKIREGDAYERLADDFDMSVSNVQKSFVTASSKLSNVVNHLIFCVFLFRARIRNVQLIRNCLWKFKRLPIF